MSCPRSRDGSDPSYRERKHRPGQGVNLRISLVETQVYAARSYPGSSEKGFYGIGNPSALDLVEHDVNVREIDMVGRTNAHYRKLIVQGTLKSILYLCL